MELTYSLTQWTSGLGLDYLYISNSITKFYVHVYLYKYIVL